jgi:hypothetical protein
MKKIKNFFAHLQFIFKPRCWIMLGKYDKAWDKTLLQLAQEHDFVPVNVDFEKKCAWVSLGDAHMWVGNYPYSFFTLEEIREIVNHVGYDNTYYYHPRNHDTQPRPSRLTIMRLHDKVVADLSKHNVTIS